MEIIKNIIIFIMGTAFGLIIKDFYKWCKDYCKLIKNAKKIVKEYKKLKENNEKYKKQAQIYNAFYEEQCRVYYINQIKEKYGDKLCTPEILTKYWTDDNNKWKHNTKINGDIYEITSIGLDTLNKNIWKSFGKLEIYD